MADLPYGWSVYTPEEIGASFRDTIESEKDIEAALALADTDRPLLRCGYCHTAHRAHSVRATAAWFHSHLCHTPHLPNPETP